MNRTAAQTQKRRGKLYAGDRFLYCVAYLFVALLTLVLLCPLVYVVYASYFTGAEPLLSRAALLPENLSLDGYKAVFSHAQLLVGFRNSILYTVFGTLINVALTLACAYPLSRRDLPLHGLFRTLFAVPLFFRGGLMPTYLLVSNLGMVGTVWALLIPNAMSVSSMFITAAYFAYSVPAELPDAAQMDGCSDARYFFKILMPLCPAIIVLIALLYAVGNWNGYFNALLYIQDERLQPLQLAARNVLLSTGAALDAFEGKAGTERAFKCALMVTASAPVLVTAPLIQKLFFKCVALGAVKA